MMTNEQRDILEKWVAHTREFSATARLPLGPVAEAVIACLEENTAQRQLIADMRSWQKGTYRPRVAARRGLRTKAEVLEQRKNAVGGGCCDRFGDQMACDCLERAVGCGICNNPKCDTPNGKH